MIYYVIGVLKVLTPRAPCFSPQITPARFCHSFAICTFVQVSTHKECLAMNLVIKERATLGEAVMAFILLMTNYQKKGYVSCSCTLVDLCTLYGRFRDYIRRVQDYNLTPSKGQVLVAKKHGLVIGTVSACFNPSATPIDDIFPDELTALRTSNQSFVYIGSFAVASSYKCTRLSLRMLWNLWSLAQKQGVGVGICVVHPDHSKFYKRFGFTEIASSTMSGLNKAPAALLVIKREDVLL